MVLIPSESGKLLSTVTSTRGDPRVEIRRAIVNLGEKSGVFKIFTEVLKKTPVFTLISTIEEHGYLQ